MCKIYTFICYNCRYYFELHDLCSDGRGHFCRRVQWSAPRGNVLCEECYDNQHPDAPWRAGGRRLQHANRSERRNSRYRNEDYQRAEEEGQNKRAGESSTMQEAKSTESEIRRRDSAAYERSNGKQGDVEGSLVKIESSARVEEAAHQKVTAEDAGNVAGEPGAEKDGETAAEQ